MFESRSCQCEDRPCCGCDNGVFEVEDEQVFGMMREDECQDDEGGEEEEDHFEGGEDSYLDASWEDRFEIEYGGD
jgi:hypothetical protein